MHGNLEVRPYTAVVKREAVDRGALNPSHAAGMNALVLRAAIDHRSTKVCRALAAERLARNGECTQAQAATLCGVGTTYVTTVAGLTPHERLLVARGVISLSQILQGAQMARHYESATAPIQINHDATLTAIGPAYVADWLDRVTAPGNSLIVTE